MLFGYGSPDKILSENDIRNICSDAFKSMDLNNKRLLFIIPDNSRTSPIDVMFRVVYDQLSESAATLDFLIALGTHPPLSDADINRRVGITQEERSSKYPKARFFNHHWDDPDQLKYIGTIKSEKLEEISEGMMDGDVEVTINKMIFDYDHLIVIGPTFPHEVVGFSGGNKYFFPGISGAEILNMFHWLGALITNPLIIGTKYTPVRKIVDLAAAMIPIKKHCISLVVKGEDLSGLYIGSPEDAWEAASELSDKLHIVYMDKPYHTVLSRSPEMYDDLWTGGKCMYKLEPVVADGGDLIIYAPHIKEVSVVHGEIIEKIGYHVRDYFKSQYEKFPDIPWGIMAHSTHVKGIGTYIDGIEKPRVNVVLATGISPEICEKINLGYKDPATINIADYEDREDEGILYVPKAGEMLHRLKN